MLARGFWWASSPKLGPAMVQRDPCEMEMVTCLGNLLLFWWDIVGCWTPMCPGGCCHDPGLTLQAPGHCFSVAFTKMQMCSDETPLGKAEPRGCGKAPGQDLGCRQHGGWCAGQKGMSCLTPWCQHSLHSCFSMAPDSSVPKLALATSNT